MSPHDLLGPDQIAARQQRAVAAAAAAGRALGLIVTEPRVLYDVFSVIVHLRPAPVAMRVHTVLPRLLTTDRAAHEAQQRRELDVTQWLAEQGHPVVRPSPLVPLEPVDRDGFPMTCWQYVEQAPGDEVSGLEDLDRIRGTARLHAALRAYPDELDFLFPLGPYVTDGLAELADRPDLLDPTDLARANSDWELLQPLTDPAGFAAAFPDATVQPIHGDAPTYNVIVTADGPLAADFEHVTRGPAEWDMVFLDEAGRAAYDAAAVELGLRPLDVPLLKVMEAARIIQLIACLPMAPQVPVLLDGIAPAIDEWRSSAPPSLPLHGN